VPPLSEEENERIYQEDILPEVSDILQAVSKPVLAFVAGQSAAGKSSAIAREMRRMKEEYGPVLVLQRDLLREFFPGYREQLRELGPEVKTLWAGHTCKGYEKLKNTARERKIAILVESTFRQPDAILKDIADFFEAGFRIEITALAVHPEISKVGVFFRYEQEIETEGQGRFVDPQTRQDAIKGLVQTIRLLETDKRISVLTISKGDGSAICRVCPSEHPSTDASNALLEAHSTLEPDEIEGINALWEQVKQKMERRNARHQEREAVRRAMEEFNQVSSHEGTEGTAEIQ
jgi:hypothetical protein